MLKCPSKPLWMLIAILIAVDIIWMIAAGFTMEVRPVVSILFFTGMICATSAYYTYIRPNEQFSTILNCTIFLIACTNALALLSYISTSLNLPLFDAEYAALDRAMGVDWLGLLAWTNDHPTFGWFLAYVYATLIPQVLFITFLLGFTNRLEQLKEFSALFAITGTIVIVTAAILPAAGAYVYHAPDPSLYADLNPESGLYHHLHVQALRDGTMRHIDLANMEGLVTFPSFHTALAIITTWAVRDFRSLVVIVGILNFFVIWSTVTEGGHYVIDIVGGVIIALVSMVVYAHRRGIFQTSARQKPNRETSVARV